MQPADRVGRLEQKIRALEREKAAESCDHALVTLRRHLNRSTSLFDRYEAIELLETLVRLARTQAHAKADEYAAALDEVKARGSSLARPLSSAAFGGRPSQSQDGEGGHFHP